MPRLALAALLFTIAGVGAAAQTSDYTVGPQDTLTITVWDQPDMSGKYVIDTDGTIAFPLLGRVALAGLKSREVETELKQKLGEGFFKNPQLSVVVEPHRNQKVFILGEVRQPGGFAYTPGMTLLEALAGAGALTVDAGDEAVILRRPTVKEDTAAAPDDNDTVDVLRSDLKKLAAGVIAQNHRLQDGDTIVISRMESIFVLGQVRNPGAFAVPKGTTVLQAISRAGGVTDRGSRGRTRIMRLVNGKQKELKVNTSDIVQAGDTVIVLERIL